MNDKPVWQIYFNNFVAFVIFIFFKYLLKDKNISQNNILFINTGQIGDIIISSVLFENITNFNKNQKIFFLINENYNEIFKNYLGPVQIINWNYKKYKFNFYYRINFLRKIRKIGFDITVNLTAARGITNDEIALLSGAREIICLNSNWRYLKKIFGKKMDSFYDIIINTNSNNEFDRQLIAIEYLTGRVPIFKT